jgi:hypothetical protein
MRPAEVPDATVKVVCMRHDARRHGGDGMMIEALAGLAAVPPKTLANLDCPVTSAAV